MRLARALSLCYVVAACLALSAGLAAPAAADSADTKGADTANVYVPPVPRAADSGPLVPAPPTWPARPQPIPRPSASASTTSSGFDWGAAGIGAGSTAVLVGVTMAGIAILLRRRRRPTRSPSLAP